MQWKTFSYLFQPDSSDNNEFVLVALRLPPPPLRVRSSIAPFRKSVSVGATALVGFRGRDSTNVARSPEK